MVFSWSRRAIVSKRSFQRQFELLETRELPSAAPLGFAAPSYRIHTTADGVTPLATAGPTGYAPAQVRHAYGFDQIPFLASGYNQNAGAGQTIAIVDAYDDPTVAGDLHQFDQAFSLPDPSLTKVNQSGGSTMPTADASWSNEIALDVEWAHAIAPAANILLVEASTSSLGNLLTGVDYARNVPGVVAVSMSWGAGEFLGETSYDSYFTTPANHTPVTFLVSSGDYGAPLEYPAASPNVVSVGGTALGRNADGTYAYLDAAGDYPSGLEAGWSGSGGGISSYESQPAYQQGIVPQSSTRRTNPDVAYDADPNTGFPVYNSFSTSAGLPWQQFGGTSDAAPQWAALVAIADQGRGSLGALDGVKDVLPALYAMPGSDFHDVISGTSTGSPNYSAGPGYDLVTGRGSPYANLVVNDLGYVGVPTPATSLSVSAPSSTTPGAPVSITVTAHTAANGTATGYTGTVHFTSSDTQANLPADYTFTAADHGVHTFSGVKLQTLGSQSITATDTADGTITGSATVAVNPVHLAFAQQPTNTAAGAVISPAVTVRVLDSNNNLVSSDNSDQVALAVGPGSPGSVLNGTTTVTVKGGVATFSNLSIPQAGTGYTLVASAPAVSSASSAAFNVVATTTVEGFENGLSLYSVVGARTPSASISAAARHDGSYGLVDSNGADWIYRNDAAAQVKQGDTISVWLQFSGGADGQAFFGFGASPSGTLSLVAAPASKQLQLEYNNGFNTATSILASAARTYQANHWYRLEVDWGTSGKIVGKVFDSDGTTLLQSVSATTSVITSGGIAFKATGKNKFWDTVTVTPGVNSFAAPASTANDTPTVAWDVLDLLWSELNDLGSDRERLGLWLS